MCISPVHHESCSGVRCSGTAPGAGVCTADQTRLLRLHNASAGLIIPRFCTLSGKIINRIPRREGIKSQKADRVLSGICLRMRYRNRAQAHSLAQEALQLFGFSTSLVDIPSKVAEVLAFVENVPRGQIRRTGTEAKSHKRTGGLQASDSLLFIIQTAEWSLWYVALFYRNSIVEEEMEVFVAVMTDAPLPSGGAAGRLHAVCCTPN